MAKKKKSCCDDGENPCSFRVEAVVGVDERGQMVLPKDVREKAGIKPGEKLALSTWERNGQVCCIFLTKAEELAELVRSSLGPLAEEIIRK